MTRKKVLLVDDVEPFLQIESRCFNEDEFEVCIARDGCDGLRKVAGEKPDLVFMDLIMPRMGGLDCCRVIKSDPKLRHIPVVMVTASGYQPDYESCREAGCDDIILKPISRRRLQRAARTLLGLKERNIQRCQARLLVRYGSNSEGLLSDYSINLSTGGLFLETAAPLPIGTPISTEFVLPDGGASIRCQARIAWVNPAQGKINPAHTIGMGVQFVDLKLNQLDAIRSFIQTESVTAVW